ncbi:Uncharacterised protein [Roseomonas gilardii subsp. rosea]|nr:Uncharacterised protein [Roseomonas gilardii subsp. rosea]
MARSVSRRAAWGAGLLLIVLGGCAAAPAPASSVPRPPPIGDRPNAPAASGGPRAEMEAPVVAAWGRS